MSKVTGTKKRSAIVKSIKRVYKGFLAVDEAVVSYRRFNGTQTTITRQSLERGDSVSVLMVDVMRRIVWLVEQFRYPTLAKGPGWLVELPAGIVDSGESPATAARRETLEETGVRPKRLERIATFYASPGGSSERIHLYFAAVSAKSDEALAAQLRDEDEDIRIIEQDIDDFLKGAAIGKIVDAKTLIAALWLDKNRARLRI